VTDVRTSLAAIQERIEDVCDKAGRPPEGVRLIAVTKKVDPERVREAVSLGITDLGENYVQEAMKKVEALGQGPVWHMIGHIQANKVKYIPQIFDYVHSVDRWEILEGLERYGKELSVLFEVNLSGETQKSGTTKDGLRAILERAGNLHKVRPVGLMTMPPFSTDPEEARPAFRGLRELLEDVNREFGLGMVELSMGMSGDFEVAIEEGATMVRIGTALFGERS
jgi:PLP dependent protein